MSARLQGLKFLFVIGLTQWTAAISIVFISIGIENRETLLSVSTIMLITGLGLMVYSMEKAYERIK